MTKRRLVVFTGVLLFIVMGLSLAALLGRTSPPADTEAQIVEPAAESLSGAKSAALAGIVAKQGSSASGTAAVGLDNGELRLIDIASGKVEEIASNVQASRLVNGGVLYFQNTPVSGIFFYDSQTKKSKLAVGTHSLETFFNFYPLINGGYIYLQADTGKVGIINPDAKNAGERNKLIAEKLLTANSYARVSGYSFVAMRPDGKRIALAEKLTPDEVAAAEAKLPHNETPTEYIKLYILDADALDLSSALYTAVIPLEAGQNLPEQTATSWGGESYIYIGRSSYVVDYAKESVAKLTKQPGYLAFSDDGQTAVSFVNSDRKSYLINLTEVFAPGWDGQGKAILPELARNTRWLSTDELVFTIGQRLYLYTISSGKLFFAWNERAPHELIGVDSETRSALVATNGSLIKLTLPK